MARTVANLAVSITARTRGLSRGLKRARSDVASFASAVGKTIAGIGTIGVVAGGAVAVGIKKQIGELSALAKTARSLGNIEPTTLIAIHDIAQQANVEIPALNKGLQFMMRTIQDAAIGKGEGLQVLKELGLDAKSLIRLKPDEQLIKISDAMKRLRGDGRDVARMSSLFGAKGLAIGGIFDSLGADGLKPFIEEVKRTGRAVDAGMLKPIESVEDRWFRVTQRIGGFFTKLTVAVAKPLDDMLAKIERFLGSKEAMERFKKIWASIATEIRDADKTLANFLANVKAIAQDMQRIVAGIGQITGGAAAAFAQTIGEGDAVSRLESILRGGPTAGSIMDQGTADAVRTLGDTPDRIKSVLESSKNAIQEAANWIRGAGKATNNDIQGAVGARGTGGSVMRFERNGQPIPFGSALGTDRTGVVDELRKQTRAIEQLGKGQNQIVIGVAG